MSNIGVPIKLLYEAEGMKVTVELKSGEIYRGLLLNAEDTMNMTLTDVVRTARNGQVSKLPTVYLRGSGVRFIALPDLLRNAPAFKKVANMKATMEAERASGGGVKRKRE
jgi:small nuclear ribonucleoprotein D3